MNLLMKKKPYKVSGKGDSIQIRLNPVCGLKDGDKVYEVLMDNGIIMIYPEAEFQKTELYKEMERDNG